MTDLDYLHLAYKAAERSPDPSTQNGAVLVNSDGFLIASACNEFPHDVLVTEERLVKPLKYQYIEHAERNAIYEAAYYGKKTQGATMYCPWFACMECARAIIQAGITEVVGHAFHLHTKRPDWQPAIERADEMLRDAGVRFRRVPGEVGGVRIRFDGELVCP